MSAPTSQPEWFDEFIAIKEDLKAVNEKLNGDGLMSRYEGAARTSLKNKIDLITSSLWSTTSGQTSTYERAYDEAAAGFEKILTALSDLDKKISKLEDALEKGGAPYTPGRFPTWKKN